MTSMNDPTALKLIAAALEHMHANQVDGIFIPLRGTDKMIVIGNQRWIDANATQGASTQDQASSMGGEQIDQGEKGGES